MATSSTTTTATVANPTTARFVSREGEPSCISVLGKIIQYNGKEYGMCYFTYDSELDIQQEKQEEQTQHQAQSVFKRGFTLPNLTLLRCNLFALVIAAEFAAKVLDSVKNLNIIIIIKHKPLYELISQQKVRKLVNATSGAWPVHLQQNKLLLKRVISIQQKYANNLAYTLVEPHTNLDGDLEFYTNCDKDPMSEDNKCPEGSAEFAKMERIAKEHKRVMMELMNAGSFTAFSQKRKPTKNDTLLTNKPQKHTSKTTVKDIQKLVLGDQQTQNIKTSSETSPVAHTPPVTESVPTVQEPAPEAAHSKLSRVEQMKQFTALFTQTDVNISAMDEDIARDPFSAACFKDIDHVHM